MKNHDVAIEIRNPAILCRMKSLADTHQMKTKFIIYCDFAVVEIKSVSRDHKSYPSILIC